MAARQENPQRGSGVSTLSDRLLLLLIQAFTTAALCEPRTKIEWDLDEEFERIDSDPKQVLVCLHLKKLSENGNVM